MLLNIGHMYETYETMKMMKLIAFACLVSCFVKTLSAATSCPLPTGTGGSKTSVTLRLYECQKSSAYSAANCGNMEKEIQLVKGATTNLNYMKNGYSIIAKFFGTQICISYRYSSSTSSVIGPVQSQKCEDKCFQDDTTITYKQSGACSDTGSYCNFVYYLIKLEVVPKDDAIGNTCPLPSDGKVGNIGRARLIVYDCIRASSSSKAACGGKPVKTVLLYRGIATSLNYDVNGYAVMAKFYGEDICVSYRGHSIRKGTSYRNTKKCEKKCFSIKETEETVTYKSEVTCSYISCGGGYHSLRFEASSKSAHEAPLFTTVLICILMKFLW